MRRNASPSSRREKMDSAAYDRPGNLHHADLTGHGIQADEDCAISTNIIQRAFAFISFAVESSWKAGCVRFRLIYEDT
jgi:hypothetical protein